MAKRRSLQNRDLEGTHIKVVKRKHYTNYYYIFPDLTKESLGNDRTIAIEAAIALNTVYYKSGDIVERIIAKRQQSATPQPRSKPQPATVIDNINRLVERYTTEHIPEQGYSQSYKTETIRRLKAITKQWGQRSTRSVTTTEVAEFMDAQAKHEYPKYRNLLMKLFSFAIHKGMREDNPVAVTLSKSAPERQSEKHTLEGFLKTYQASPDWLKRAILIAVFTVQRREDLVTLHKDQIDLKEGTILVNQSKTANYKNPIRLKIKMGKELLEAVQACFNSGITCPYLIHYRPERMTETIRASKLHPYAVTGNHLTKQFAKYRDESGAYIGIPKELRPTWHDLRGFGMYLYRQAGYPLEYIQALAGHASTNMTTYYIEGHEPPKPVLVAADLSMKGNNEAEQIQNKYGTTPETKKPDESK